MTEEGDFQFDREPKNERGGRGRGRTEGNACRQTPRFFIPFFPPPPRSLLASFFARSLTLVPRSLLLNPKPHRNACYAGYVSLGGTSATQRQKFHADDVKSVRNPVRSADWTTE